MTAATSCRQVHPHAFGHLPHADVRDCGLTLPRHTFFVDNIFVYVPLPNCERIYYMDVDLYRYFIGREDQSVNESVMIGRIDQQLRVTRIMIDSFLLERDVKSPRLRSYMRNSSTMMMVICTVFSMMSDREDKDSWTDVWKYLREHDYQTYVKIRRSVMGVGTRLPARQAIGSCSAPTILPKKYSSSTKRKTKRCTTS